MGVDSFLQCGDGEFVGDCVGGRGLGRGGAVYMWMRRMAVDIRVYSFLKIHVSYSFLLLLFVPVLNEMKIRWDKI